MEEIKEQQVQPSPEEMVQLLSQTVIQQQEEINNLNKSLAGANDYIKQLKDELESLPKLHEVQESESSIRYRAVHTYLNEELDYAKEKIKELRCHIAEYPEDSYSQTDLQNCLLHINYLKAMIRRLCHFTFRG